VIYNGKLVADADPATITPEELGSAMTGAATGHLASEETPETSADTSESEEDEAR
jgi:simple sugar transport system ATP-binding protein